MPLNTNIVDELTKGMPIPNRDIFVSEQIQSAFDDLKAILRNDDLEAFFREVEDIAKKRKRLFTKAGATSLVL